MDEYDLHSHLNNYKLYYIVLRIGRRVMQDVAVYLLLRVEKCPLRLFKESPITLLEASEDKEKPEFLKSIDKAWKVKEIKCLWTDWDLIGDIFYCYRVIQTLFCNLFRKLENFKDDELSGELKEIKDNLSTELKKLKDNLSKELKELKKYRNDVCHTIGIVVELETYDKEVKKVREMFRNIYDKIKEDMKHVGDVEYMDIESRIGDINKHIDEVEKFDLKSFKKEFDKDAGNAIIWGTRNEHKKSTQYNTSTPCSWMWGNEMSEGFVVDKIFTPLKQDNRGLDMKGLLKVMSKGTQSVVLTGLAGSGKTTLCRFVRSEWLKTSYRGLNEADGSEEIEDVGEFNVLIYFELRHYIGRVLSKENTTYYCLKEGILKETLSKILKFDSTGKFGIVDDQCMRILQNIKILFIIDGFDEGPENGKLILADIIKHFENSKIILSTRFEYQQEVENVMRVCSCRHKIVKICGFDDEGLRDFSEKVFTALVPDEITRKVELDAFLEMMWTKARVLDKYLRLPLTTALLITLWHYCPDERKSLANTKTATELYEVMFKLWQERVQDRLILKSPTKEIDCRELLDYLSEIAWIHLKVDELCIGAEHLEKFDGVCKKIGIDEDEGKSAFLVHEGKAFSFMHKTVMEYLAACHLVSLMEKKVKCVTEFFDHEDKCSKFRELFRYLTGCMSGKKLLMKQAVPLLKVIDRADIDKTDYNYWYSLVIESHGNHELCREIRYRVKGDVWKLADETVVAGLRVLAFTIPEISCLELMVYENPYEIKGFLESMRLLQENTFKKKKGWLYDKKNPIEVKLVLRHCVTMPDSRDTDEFLRTLFPWGHLTYYEGHLGKRSGETLSYCFKLKHMVARVSSVAALKVLSDSLKCIGRKKVLRSLHIMLDIGNDTVPDVAMEFNGNLDITIPSSREADIKWIDATVFSLGKGVGCRDLVLKNCDMTRSGVERLVKIIAEKESVHHKLSLYLISELGEKEEMELEHHVRKRYKFFDIEFF